MSSELVARSGEPNLLPFVPGLERYRAPGGGAVMVPLLAGDEIALTDREGEQRCEVTVLGSGDGEDPGALGLSARERARGLLALIAEGGEPAAAIGASLGAAGIGPESVRAATVFDEATRRGETRTLTAERACLCIVCAPGGPMPVDAQTPPTDIAVTVRRRLTVEYGKPPLPAPLAEPRLDIPVDRATVRAYEVRAGEYIQIVDVEGRQCSDFLAFHRADLDRGMERFPDATATRYIEGAAYPQPGLHSKFFDQDLRAIVEVVRDTVGRHDTFGLACNAKFYEDMGYPGHVNCTDNFNDQLGAYEIAPRRGWPAINFFYNTHIDSTNALRFDEPWSRPGDYVLLRASTDLVCASSACPDDVDPANGWNPTDIHVRVYPAKNLFSKAVAYRMSPDTEAQLTRETAFHPRTTALTRDFVEYRGVWLPNQYRDHGAIAEYHACRERAVVMDLSALRKFEVLGPDAEELLQRTLTRDIRRLALGQVMYSAMVNETGGMLDDGTVFRLGGENFRWICGDDYGGIWLRKQAEAMGLNVRVKTSTSQLHNLAVQGPESRQILADVVWTPDTQPSLRELRWFRFAIGRIGGSEGAPIVVSRTGYTGELGYEVWCHPKDAVAVWDAIQESGRGRGLAPLGLAALDMLRIEAGLVFAGCEFDDQTDPYEAGIGFTVAAKEDEEPIGKSALLRAREHPRRKLVGLELAGNEPASHGDGVYVERSQVGVVTSGMRSPILKKNIALARVAVEHAQAGEVLQVGKLDGQQKRIAAIVTGLPFYDPERKRVRSRSESA